MPRAAKGRAPVMVVGPASQRCDRDLELKKASQPIRQISGSSRRNNQYMNPFSSFVFLSTMRRFNNALVTFSNRICYGSGEKGHYVNKYPQRHPNGQPTEMGIATTQSIQFSNSYKSQIIGNQNVQRLQATQNAIQTPAKRKCYNYGERSHHAIMCPNPRSRPPLPLSTKTAPNHKGGSTLAKATTSCFKCDKLVILPIDALIV
jgi:hypothetical protein